MLEGGALMETETLEGTELTGTLLLTLPLGTEELTPPLGAALLTDAGGVDEGMAELSVGSS